MLILALDTTTRGGSAAIVRDAELLSLVAGDQTRTHGERLPGEIDRALREAGLHAAALDLLVVASGPGAFTGLRIGLAAIQGLAMVTGLPVVAVSALDALADTVWSTLAADPTERRLVVWMDAQRGEVFVGRYAASGGGWMADGEPSVGPPDALLSALPQMWRDAAFVGDGATRYCACIEQWSAAASVIATPAALAPALARIGGRRAAAGGAGPPHALQPLYVRRPDAEIERERRTPPA